ncbi:hypothetical protein ACHAPT_008307 [Fusarium lateritium]
MAQPTTPFVIQGRLLELWNDAQKEFTHALDDAGHVAQRGIEKSPDPEGWLKAFKGQRRGSGKFDVACRKISPYLEVIQRFVAVAGFSVDIASTAAPAVSPASLVMNGFAWLLNSFTDISADFDTIEQTFEKISRCFEDLTIIKDHLVGQSPDLLQERIVQLFICCLRFCRVGADQISHRTKKWGRKLVGTDPFEEELRKLVEADNSLRACIGMKNLDAALSLKESVNKLVDASNLSDRDEILNWLSTLDFSRMHSELEHRVSESPVAGRWLLKSPEFERWRDGDSNRLWYTGKPGAGKSVLVSIIINHLKKRLQHSNDGVIAYLYLSYKSKPDRTELLGSVLRQFQAKEHEIHPAIREKFDEYRREGKHDGEVNRPIQKDLMCLLEQFTANRPTYIVVDAMDECEYVHREPLIKELKGINPHVKILITGRDFNHRSSLQRDFEKAVIEAKDEDVDEFISNFIDSNNHLKAELAKYHGEIKSEVKRTAGKMFLIARLHMEALSAVEVEAEIEDVLYNLPDTIEGTYENTMKRIHNSSDNKKDWARATLAWVTYAQRPLSIGELRYALAMGACPRTSSSINKYLRNEDEIISGCYGLLIKDLDGIVRFVHKSAWDFFQRTRAKEFPNFDKTMTISCARYLCLSPDEQLREYGEVDLPVHSMFPFSEYAGENLHAHHRQLSTLDDDQDVFEAISSLVENQASRELYSRLLYHFQVYDRESTALDGRESRFKTLEECYSKPLGKLHIAAFLGNLQLVRELSENSSTINVLDPFGQSALMVAIKNGLDSVAGVLLQHKAELSLMTKKGHIVLLYAMERNFKTTARHIIDSSTSDEQTGGFLGILGLLMLFMFACFRILISRLSPQARFLGSQSVKSSQSNTQVDRRAKFEIALKDHLMMLKLAYQGNVDGLLHLTETSAPDVIKLQHIPPEDDTARDSVSDDEDFEWEDDDNFDLQSRESEALLTRSLLRSHVAFGFKSQGETSSVSSNDILADDHAKGSPYYRGAGTSKQDDICLPILDDPMSDPETDEGSENPFHRATVGAVKEDEMAKRNDVKFQSRVEDIRNAFVRTACFLAVERGHCDVVKWFLDKGMTPDLTNFQGQSLLHRAAARSSYKMVRLLLDYGVKVEKRDRNGRTALLANAGMGNERGKSHHVIIMCVLES